MNNEILKFALNQEDEIIKHSTIPFNRIDEWHSIIGLSEIASPRMTQGKHSIGATFRRLLNSQGNIRLVDESELVKDDSFPANQSAVSTLTFVDDDYTYIVNQVHCFDNHEGPQLMGFILRLDKEEYTGKAVPAFELFTPPEGEGA